MKWIDYREKLGIGFNDSEKRIMINNKITNRLNSIFETIYGDYNIRKKYEVIISKYFTEIGEPVPFNANLYHIAENISREQTLCGVISKYIALLNLLNKICPKEDYDIFYRFLEQSLTELKIQYEAIEDADGVFLFPKGAPELDDALVSAPLEWLSEYPESHTAWIKALKSYSEQTDENASDIADKFRKALETFFQEFFSQNKSIENMKSIYGAYLKEHGIPGEISNNLETLLLAYTNYMNSNVKHHDKATRNVLEYIMYQTGNIIRLLITLKQEEDAHAD